VKEYQTYFKQFDTLLDHDRQMDRRLVTA